MKALATFLLVISYLFRVFATNVPCRTRAWVRAPNLEPGQIVQGHVKVKLDGTCANVSSYRLGLRFTEHSWVKTRRAGATIPSNPYEFYPESSKPPPLYCRNRSNIYTPRSTSWYLQRALEDNKLDQDQYKKYMNDLWQVREEERIAFETRYPLKFDAARDSNSDMVRSFALLVPSTIYPPAFDANSRSVLVADDSNSAAEHIYMYFVDVNFSNGSHREVEAGYTSFSSPVEPLNGPADSDHNGQGPEKFKAGPESVNVTASNIKFHSSFNTLNLGAGDSLDANNTLSRDTFTLEITFPEGRHFEQGSMNNITIKSHQIGPGLERPLRIQYLSPSIEQKYHWAAKHVAENKTAEVSLLNGRMYQDEIWPKPEDNCHRSCCLGVGNDSPQFSQEGVVQNGTLFSTEAVAAQFSLTPHAYPSFEMYYQTSEANLMINMATRNASDTVSEDATLDNEEYDWVPTSMHRKRLNYQVTHVFRAAVPIYVHRKPEYHVTPIPHVVHYLSPDARAPVFVDPSNVAHLLQMTVEDRDTLAPLAQAKFITHGDEDVLKNRRFQRDDLHYVGNTWLRKVVQRGRDKEAAQQRGTLVIQT